MATTLPTGADVPLRSQSVRTPRRPLTTARPEPTPRSESSTRVEASRPDSSPRPQRRPSQRAPSQASNTAPRPQQPTANMPSSSANANAAAGSSAGDARASSAHGAQPDPKARAAKNRYRTVIPAPSGNYIFVKTIGQGSMGKVKLAKKEGTNEQVACKIIERVSPDDGRQSREDREKADNAREIRNAREAAIVSLLDHRYICGLRDNLRTKWHWYMLFEYVNGGQMLDYIISHGKLKEKQARKFARQIASAVDYCHRNSIVHRDLKIENILIHKNGDIKIIDFGLSNLFAPEKQLQTFCGSLYFAAPELLQARPYTGPEVDVWSFGVVLFVLVCGKVPFDDQYMPALHAKIKKGLVDYPNWLSSECKNLISRMLVTDPKQRATMQEVMNHPWMVKGYGGPPENYLPPREPLTLPLEPGVIHAMTGFGFGTPEDIQHRLTRIVESRRYKQAIENYEKDRGAPLIPPKDVEKRSGFGGLFSKGRNTVASRETLNASMEGLKLGEDPLNAFHPMVSIYYLVKEKQERDQKEQKERGEQQHTTPKLQPPTSRQEPLKQPSPVARPKEKHSMAEITPPQPVHTEPRARQRARSHSEDQARDQVDDGLLQIPARQEGSFAGMLRRLSTRGPRRPKDLLDPKSASNPMPQRGAMSMRASKSLGHARRESIQARRAKREAEKKQEAKELPTTAQPVKEETDAEILGNSHGNVDGADDASAGGMSNDDRLEHADSSSADLAKPVFLRGIFSVSTTSTRPLPEIRADIKRVLKQLDVDYTEIKGGFSCTHAPSVVDEPDSLEPTVPGGEIQFEILVVKVPIVSLHGVQFKRVGGNTWQYKNMAEQVVKELRL